MNVLELNEAYQKQIIEYVRNNQPTLYFDYTDKITDEQVKELLSSNQNIDDALSELSNYIYKSNIDYILELEHDLVIKTMKHVFGESEDNEDNEDIVEFIREQISVDMNIDDLISRTDVNVVVTLFSNYDCQLSNYNSVYEYKESYFKDMLDLLNINPKEFKKEVANRREFLNNKYGVDGCSSVEISGSFPDLKHRADKSIIDINTFIIELENNSSTSLFKFFVTYNLLEAIELIKNSKFAKYLRINKGTTCGLFSDFQGGGSMLECKVLNDSIVKIKKDAYTYITVDTENSLHSYTVKDVFGQDDFFSKGKFNLFK